MSNYPGRRAHNLVNLNIIPSEHDQQQEAKYNFAGDTDLGVFADSDFLNLDWAEDMNGTANGGTMVNNADIGGTTGGRANGTGNGPVGQEGLDFANGESLLFNARNAGCLPNLFGLYFLCHHEEDFAGRLHEG